MSLETVTGGGSRFAMVQEYVPDIAKEGDKRILLIDGQPVPLALVRIPPAGDHRAISPPGLGPKSGRSPSAIDGFAGRLVRCCGTRGWCSLESM